jgi:hypothetical protein
MHRETASKMLPRMPTPRGVGRPPSRGRAPLGRFAPSPATASTAPSSSTHQDSNTRAAWPAPAIPASAALIPPTYPSATRPQLGPPSSAAAVPRSLPPQPLSADVYPDAPETLSWFNVPLIAAALGIPYPAHATRMAEEALQVGYAAAVAEDPLTFAANDVYRVPRKCRRAC